MTIQIEMPLTAVFLWCYLSFSNVQLIIGALSSISIFCIHGSEKVKVPLTPKIISNCKKCTITPTSSAFSLGTVGFLLNSGGKVY